MSVYFQGVQTNGYVLMAEMTKKKYLPAIACLFEIFWAFGTLWLAALAWFVKDWRQIQLIMSLSSLITVFYIT